MLDTFTQPPALTTPQPGALLQSILSFRLPESPLATSVRLTVVASANATDQRVCTLSGAAAASNTLSINFSSLSDTTSYACTPKAAALKAGADYNLSLAYRDIFNNSEMASSPVRVLYGAFITPSSLRCNAGSGSSVSCSQLSLSGNDTIAVFGVFASTSATSSTTVSLSAYYSSFVTESVPCTVLYSNSTYLRCLTSPGAGGNMRLTVVLNHFGGSSISGRTVTHNHPCWDGAN
jgi:hypothetical protein